VNSLRLAEVQRRLLKADARQLTVLALALEAGFNSKSTFNRIFKEKTDLTPKGYRKKYQPT
jgi:AraC-like DNA-binding protein